MVQWPQYYGTRWDFQRLDRLDKFLWLSNYRRINGRAVHWEPFVEKFQVWLKEQTGGREQYSESLMRQHLEILGCPVGPYRAKPSLTIIGNVGWIQAVPIFRRDDDGMIISDYQVDTYAGTL